MSRAAALLIALLAATTLNAQISGFRPPNPTDADRIFVDLRAPYLGYEVQPVVISGSEIRITLRGYVVLPAFASHSVDLGRLPGGTYSVIVTFIREDEQGEPAITTILPPVTLQVTPGHFVPALEPRTVALLIAMLAVAGAIAARR
jgi:hypothetical protein